MAQSIDAREGVGGDEERAGEGGGEEHESGDGRGYDQRREEGSCETSESGRLSIGLMNGVLVTSGADRGSRRPTWTNEADALGRCAGRGLGRKERSQSGVRVRVEWTSVGERIGSGRVRVDPRRRQRLGSVNSGDLTDGLDNGLVRQGGQDMLRDSVGLGSARRAPQVLRNHVGGPLQCRCTVLCPSRVPHGHRGRAFDARMGCQTESGRGEGEEAEEGRVAGKGGVRVQDGSPRRVVRRPCGGTRLEHAPDVSC